ncbi:solute carrier family 66 member 3 isoform X2 [Syngnathus typhle]|uniref:solute carrier family 66 member 3 isoform X2 n=1 Tax=Syngnathus typhle TaxID=161592 RepID=UPI002A6A20D1|nr:solute carrier family 66 member 3 isoform X2 [Syngnathus typhle]
MPYFILKCKGNDAPRESESASTGPWHPKQFLVDALCRSDFGISQLQPLNKMQSETLLHLVNFSILLVCMVLKFPQIFVLLRAKSTTGISLKSLVLEIIGYIVFITYAMYYDYPSPTYLEYPILIAQDAVLLLLILFYSGRLQDSLVYGVILVVGWRLLTVEKWIIDFAMSLCTLISAASKFAQLQCLWRSKDSGQVSALTWALATYTCANDISLQPGFTPP